MNKSLAEERKGELNIISSVLIWSLFPVITILSLQAIPPVLALAWTTFFAFLFFGLIFLWQKKWVELKQKNIWIDLFWVYLINGILYYTLIFWGLQHTSAGNASIFLLMEIFFSFLWFGLWNKETLTKAHIQGALLMVLGSLFILFPGEFKLQKGDLLITLATMIVPFGNYFQKKARKKISTVSIHFTRSIVAAPFLFFIAFLVEPSIKRELLIPVLPILAFSGAVLFGISKILWVEGMHRISISKSVAFLSIGPAFTLFFAYLFLNEIPTTWQILGLIPIMFGVRLLTRE